MLCGVNQRSRHGGSHKHFPHTVWNTAGVLRVSTAGSPFNTVLGVYNTTTTTDVPTFGSLTLLGTNNNCGTSVLTSCVAVPVVRSGVRYLVKVDGFAGAKGAVATSFNFAAV